MLAKKNEIIFIEMINTYLSSGMHSRHHQAVNQSNNPKGVFHILFKFSIFPKTYSDTINSSGQ